MPANPAHRIPVTPPGSLTPMLVDDVTARHLLGGISRRTLYGLRAAGLPHIRLAGDAGKVLYSPTALAAWIASQTVTAPEVTR